MTETALATKLAEIFAGGAGEAVATVRFLPLVTLESGLRIAIDPEGRWVVVAVDGGGATVIEADSAHLLHEVVEQKRDAFEETLEKSANAAGLPGSDVVFAFPAVPMMKAILAKRSAYLTRLVLEWLRPSERRDLRKEIVEVSQTGTMPGPVKDLARRLVVRD